MSRSTRRKLWLALIAAGNLMFWAGVALAVSVLAGDRLDLGIEQAMREARATALASWRPEAGIARPSAHPALQELVIAPLPLPAASAASTISATAPSPTVQAQAGLAAAGAGEEAPGSEPTAAASPAALEASLPGASTPAAAVVQPAASGLPAFAPLLLADPSFSDLTQLDKELARSASGRPVQIRYLEAALNREIAALLAAPADLPYRNVTAVLRAGSVVVAGDVTVLGLAVRAEAEGLLVAAACRPRIELARVKIGKLFTPPVVREQVEGLLDAALDWYPDDYPLCLEEIVVQEGRITAYGHRR